MRLLLSITAAVAPLASAFAPQGAGMRATTLFSSVPSDVSSAPSLTLNELKADLVRTCTAENKPSLNEVKTLVQELEEKAEMVGEGQSSSSSGLMSGEWELMYSPEDVTRSSPFFWAFAQAFPDNSDQIFGITDAIPAPIKEIGPAYQTIEGLTEGTSTGKLVSRVKVATLNGLATSIMTTRADITGAIGLDGLMIRIETTKPEESTALEKLGPLGNLLNDNLPPFPSGQALEQVVPGSSTVIMRTTFCDDGLRISRNDAKYDEPYVWRRRKFSGMADL
mmetsp:Transcript_29101/g.68433  ORF Transcript_29101/g.68433 Transcript_29101/m.68433 type:complete len:279 (+) Transcript_29101:112-948(+)